LFYFSGIQNARTLAHKQSPALSVHLLVIWLSTIRF
jgi:hypothetical protein